MKLNLILASLLISGPVSAGIGDGDSSHLNHVSERCIEYNQSYSYTSGRLELKRIDVFGFGEVGSAILQQDPVTEEFSVVEVTNVLDPIRVLDSLYVREDGYRCHESYSTYKLGVLKVHNLYIEESGSDGAVFDYTHLIYNEETDTFKVMFHD